MQTFYSHGKLLISAEYLVLDGAIALALPTKYGQSLAVEQTHSQKIVWQSFNVQKKCWFRAEFDLKSLTIVSCFSIKNDEEKVANTLQEILKTAKSLNPSFLMNTTGIEVKTTLEFPNEWGLGTSSTLINNIASWANINAFELLTKSFGGSGYDIACAQNGTPITFQKNGLSTNVTVANFNPVFKEKLFFVYLNQKQDSKEGIQTYRALQIKKQPFIDKANLLTKNLTKAVTLLEFEELMTTHEALIASLLGIKTVKQKLFADFKGAVKSLGAWGGDFVMVTGDKEDVKTYFSTKGYHTILPYKEMILS